MEQILVEKKENICRITFINEKKMNAANAKLTEELLYAFDKINEAEDIYCVILRSKNEKAFICGSDIAQIKNMTREQAIDFSLNGSDLLNKIKGCKVPVIAEIKGYCLGAGMEIAAACDIRIASANAKFAHPEVGLGLLPAFGGDVFEKNIIDNTFLSEALYTSNSFDVKKAVGCGFINKVYDDEVIDDAVLKLAERIASNSPVAVKMMKKSLNKDMCIDESSRQEIANAFADILETEDTKMAIEAFLNNKKPEKFSNK